MSQLFDHRQPRDIELPTGRLTASARYSIGLFNQRDVEADSARGPRRRPQVGRLDAASRPMPKHQGPDGVLNEVRMDPCRPMGRVQLENDPRVPVAGGGTEPSADIR